jgi:hypothetical protein
MYMPLKTKLRFVAQGCASVVPSRARGVTRSSYLSVLQPYFLALMLRKRRRTEPSSQLFARPASLLCQGIATGEAARASGSRNISRRILRGDANKYGPNPQTHPARPDSQTCLCHRKRIFARGRKKIFAHGSHAWAVRSWSRVMFIAIAGHRNL